MGKTGVQKEIKKRTAFADLSQEKKDAIKQRQAARAEKEGRSTAGNATYKGKVVSRGRHYGWIKPAEFKKLPVSIREKVTEMTAGLKAKSEENGNDSDKFSTGVIYMRMCDVVEGVKIETDMDVTFKIYTDEKGVGAYEVNSA